MSTDVMMSMKATIFILDDEIRKASIGLTDEVTRLREARRVGCQYPTLAEDTSTLELVPFLIPVNYCGQRLCHRLATTFIRNVLDWPRSGDTACKCTEDAWDHVELGMCKRNGKEGKAEEWGTEKAQQDCEEGISRQRSDIRGALSHQYMSRAATLVAITRFFRGDPRIFRLSLVHSRRSTKCESTIRLRCLMSEIDHTGHFAITR